MEFRILELFSGIGGMHLAFNYAGLQGSVVAAIDINTVANAVYAHNNPSTPVSSKNIQSLTAKYLKEKKINIILMSPPCQPHTRVGKKLDIDDPRSAAFQHIISLLPECDGVNYVLMENVKGFEKSQARSQYITALETAGFYYREFILSPHQFGVPNTRHRYYCLARRNEDFAFQGNQLWQQLPCSMEIMEPSHAIIANILESDSNIYESVYVPDKILQKYSKTMDIVTPQSRHSTCFTKAYTHYSEGTGSILSPENSIELVKEILEKIKSKENNLELELLRKLKLRYFTPREVARLMSFPEEFSFPAQTSQRQCYRLLGNSINVKVVGELIKLLCCS